MKEQDFHVFVHELRLLLEKFEAGATEILRALAVILNPKSS